MRGLVCSHGGADDLWKKIAHTKSPEIQPNVKPHSLEKYSRSTEPNVEPHSLEKYSSPIQTNGRMFRLTLLYTSLCLE